MNSRIAAPSRMAFFRTRAKAVLALGVLAGALAGCVVYPDGGYGAPGYYAPPVVGSVVVGGGYGWGHGWGWRRGWR